VVDGLGIKLEAGERLRCRHQRQWQEHDHKADCKAVRRESRSRDIDGIERSRCAFGESSDKGCYLMQECSPLRRYAERESSSWEAPQNELQNSLRA